MIDKKQLRFSILVFSIMLIGMVCITNIGQVLSVAPPPSTHLLSSYGYVRSITGKPLAGATVKVYDIDGILVGSTTTSSSGYYFMKIYTYHYATFTVKASKSGGYNSQTATIYSSGSQRKDFSLGWSTYYQKTYYHTESVYTDFNLAWFIITGYREYHVQVKTIVRINPYTGEKYIYSQTMKLYTTTDGIPPGTCEYTVEYNGNGYWTADSSYKSPVSHTGELFVSPTRSTDYDSFSGLGYRSSTEIHAYMWYIEIFDQGHMLIIDNGYFNYSFDAYAV
ncbi:MAG: hypothetical protein GF308_09120 [Candidatus Heimdallarchaeota archaeon]|nr:hypothetical protein [Candidatus Heimdallarchaeota archaeon]